MMNVNNLKYSFIATFLLVLSHMPLSLYAASYPDFTEIVEQNMPAVVIVNATRSTNPNNSNQFQTPPGMPD